TKDAVTPSEPPAKTVSPPPTKPDGPGTAPTRPPHEPDHYTHHQPHASTPATGSDSNTDPSRKVRNTSLTIPDQGTYTLNTTTGVITFTPILGYTGTATPATYRITDPYNQTDTATPTVNPPPPPVADGGSTIGNQAIQQSFQVDVPPGGSAALLINGQRGHRLAITGQGTYLLDPKLGLVTFVPEPGFAGKPDPVTIEITDAYGQTVSVVYQPEVLGVSGQSPTATVPSGQSSAGRTSRLASTGTGTSPVTVGAVLLALGAALMASRWVRPGRWARR
ncbi:MAG: Ig-like domain-containing protein, partial [Acidimicrobiales bacterium]